MPVRSTRRSRLLGAVDSEVLDELGRGRVEMLHGQIAFDQFRAGEAARHLAGAAKRLEPVAIGLARKTHLEALGASMYLGDRDGPAGMRTIAEAALRAPPPRGSPAASDALLEGYALLLTEGHRAAAPSLRRARELVLAPHPATDDHGHWLWFAVAGNAITIAQELWDADAWRALSARHEQFARDSGALVQLQFALNMVAWVRVLAGDLTESAQALEEERMIADATGNRPISFTDMLVAAGRGQDGRAAELIEATTREAPARGRVACFAAYASAVLHNGLGRHAEARDAARSAFDPDHLGFGPFVVPELAEAAARTGDAALLTSLLEWLTERTHVTRSEWSLGTEARVRALMSEGDAAESAYREAIDRFGRTWLRPELARGHLLYGEWLRREGRRVDAREQLRTAHQMLDAIGMQAFAERARRELLATGEKARKRTVDTRDELDRSGAADRRARPRWPFQPRDRRPALPQLAHGRMAPGQGVRQARDHLAHRPSRCPAKPRPGGHARVGSQTSGVASTTRCPRRRSRSLSVLSPSASSRAHCACCAGRPNSSRKSSSAGGSSLSAGNVTWST